MGEYITYICLLIGLGCSVYITFEDFRTRYISWYPLAGLFLSGVFFHWEYSLEYWTLSAGLNLGFILLMLAVLVIYLRLKGVKGIMDTYLGWGDIVMMIAVLPWFSFEQYIFWYVGSTIFALMVSLFIIKLRKKEKDYPIPFAGYMGMMFVCFQLLQ
ncbi:MAG: hypothetical protein R3B93_19075 [Bacteroidia bacterium]